MRQLSLSTLFLFISVMAFAGPNGKFVYHTVEKGETLYSISHMYGLKPADVAQYNDALGDKLTIHVGQKIKIPASDIDATADITPASSVAVPVNAVVPAKATSVSKYHTVEKGETIYSISKMYEISRDDLLSWNKIKDNKIAIGQKLVIKEEGNAAATAEKPQTANPTPTASKEDAQKAMKKDGYTWTLPSQSAKNSTTNVSTATADATASASSAGGLADTKTIKSWKAESASDMKEYYNAKPKTYDPATEYESLYYQNIYSGMLKKSETGVAKFLADNNAANTAYYNNAPIGTILKLTNADNGKSTYAIVVGKIPEAEQNSYLMKLSSKVARNLSAKDYSSIEIVCYTEN